MANEPIYKKLGPGLITGAADDDPSGIATYSQAGAQFGLNMLWVAFFTYPLMVGIQVISARIGIVTGHGVATNIRKHFPKSILYFLITALLVANTINIAADISAMGNSLTMMVGGPTHIYTMFFGVLIIVLEVFIPYHRYVRILKWLSLSLLAYVAMAFVIHIPWGQVLKSTFLPNISLSEDYITTIVALFGTTISPYMFFWQASEEVEEQRNNPLAHALKNSPHLAAEALKRIDVDTYVGMGFSNIVSYFIILATALTLHANGITDIQTSEQAASALRPLAGDFAFFLFGLGIIGTGFLAIPVLAGSAAYAMAETFSWRSGLEQKPTRAKKFYAVIVVSTLIGVALGFTSFNPIQALYWSAVINGVISVPIMIVMLLMASKTEVMGQFKISTTLKILGWIATLVMAIAVMAMLKSYF